MAVKIETDKSNSRRVGNMVLRDAWLALVKNALYNGGVSSGERSKLDPHMLKSVISKIITNTDGDH